MRILILLFLLLPCWLVAQELSVEEDIALTVKGYEEKADSARKRDDWEKATKWRRLALQTVLSTTVKPVFLEDQYGERWNLGVLDQPFVVHGLSDFSSGLNETKVAAANVIAEENATKLMTFLLMPPPVNALDSQLLASVSEKIVVVFMEIMQLNDRKAGDTRLLNLLNSYPITYYIRANREIAGVKFGVMMARPGEKNMAETTKEEAHEKNLKQLRKNVRALLRGKKIKRY